MGLGTQLTGWPEEFCEDLVSLGYHVLRFDNRDIGLSMRLDHARAPNIPGLVLRKSIGLRPRVPTSWTTWPRTRSGYSMPSASDRRTWSAPPWAE
jgi:alpha-beta hydrolase superfamily lysophospholipase